MLYTPSSVAAADLEIAKAPFFGAEFAVYVSFTPAVLLGEITLSAAGAGTFAANAGAQFGATATELQVVATTPVLTAAQLVLKIAGLNNATPTPASQDGTATFAMPTREENQSFSFSQHFAQDFVAATKFTSLTGLAVSSPVTGGGRRQKFQIYRLPEMANYTLIGATTESSFNSKARQSKGVNRGMETDYWVKRGMSGAAELSLGNKFESLVNGLARFNGHRVTVMLEGLKDDVVLNDRLVFVDWACTVGTFRLPTEDGEATMDATGKFKQLLAFVAPDEAVGS